MIISKTPLRMSFVGGGSDLSSFYRMYGGSVLSTTLNKYVYVSVKHRFEPGIRLSYSRTENVEKLEDIEHPLVRNALSMLNIGDDLEIVSMADIPSSGTGLGSSSSFAVGLLSALLAFKNREITKLELAELACRLEIELCGSPIGKQDQYAASFGGLKKYKFNRDDTVDIEDIECCDDVYSLIDDQLISFYVAGSRDANTILRRQSELLSENESKVQSMLKMVALVDDLARCYQDKDFRNFGDILHQNWLLKKSISDDISSNKIDKIYGEALSAGATGGKLLGAGGGGFMLFHVPSLDIKKRVTSRLNKLRVVDFKHSAFGSLICFND